MWCFMAIGERQVSSHSMIGVEVMRLERNVLGWKGRWKIKKMKSILLWVNIDWSPPSVVQLRAEVKWESRVCRWSCEPESVGYSYISSHDPSYYSSFKRKYDVVHLECVESTVFRNTSSAVQTRNSMPIWSSAAHHNSSLEVGTIHAALADRAGDADQIKSG
jgi:hypothetical protein